MSLHRAPVAVRKMERRNGLALLRTRRTIPTGIKMHSREILPTRKPPPSKCLPVHGHKRVAIQARSGHQSRQLQAMEGVRHTMDWLGCLYVQRRRDLVTRHECLRRLWSCLNLVFAGGVLASGNDAAMRVLTELEVYLLYQHPILVHG